MCEAVRQEAGEFWFHFMKRMSGLTTMDTKSTKREKEPQRRRWEKPFPPRRSRVGFDFVWLVCFVVLHFGSSSAFGVVWGVSPSPHAAGPETRGPPTGLRPAALQVQ